MQNGIIKNNKIKGQGKSVVAMIALFLSLVIPVSNGLALTNINVEKLATAIYFAEGGTATAHPYGILAPYVHTSPRQACINMINSAIRRYEKTNQRMDFITFLSKTYCPIGASNDPTGLNVNWVKNVTKLYKKGRS